MYKIDLGYEIICCESFEGLSDSDKQQIAEKAIGSHVFNCANTLIDYILHNCPEDYENVPFTTDDIINYNVTGYVDIKGYQEELTQDERDEKLEFYEYLRDKKQDYQNHLITCVDDGSYDDRADKIQEQVDNIDSICDNLEEMDFDKYPEIYQWFSVSDRLYNWLRQDGSCVLDGSFYGRQCCGQSLALDSNMQRFAFEVLAQKEVASNEVV